ncbi:lytic murein transglycosylase [Aeromicrobium sp. HA]|uniref:lytic murein transglycosylase n=1 Tax=Aeromicrobium sp. HA TaxID=3009077 RepID=UPI0022AF033C|nr:lytic murein transglycosylase [Aeromicrobium sp. HA]
MRRAARLRLAVTAVVAVAGASAVAVVAAAALTGGVETLAIADDRVQGLSAEVAAPSPGAGASPVSGVDPAWVRRNAERTGIPAVAVRAYADAALTVASEQPACHVGWTTLAGIATVESDHGRHGGGGLDAHGRTTVPIIGPALDGSPGLAAIPADLASTARHGDPVWDHAVGPFQFIGSTWDRWSADGDGDGVEDPHDLDDAALAAARYLCASGEDLRTGHGWSRAIHSYNHSDEYVLAVLAAAESVAR